MNGNSLSQRLQPLWYPRAAGKRGEQQRQRVMRWGRQSILGLVKPHRMMLAPAKGPGEFMFQTQPLSARLQCLCCNSVLGEWLGNGWASAQLALSPVTGCPSWWLCPSWHPSRCQCPAHLLVASQELSLGTKQCIPGRVWGGLYSLGCLTRSMRCASCPSHWWLPQSPHGRHLAPCTSLFPSQSNGWDFGSSQLLTDSSTDIYGLIPGRKTSSRICPLPRHLHSQMFACMR